MSRAVRLLAIAGLAVLVLSAVPQSTSSADDEIVYVTKTGKCYHRDGCSSLRSSKIPMRLSEAAVKYAPCRICKPPVPAAGAASAADNARGDGKQVKPDPKRAPGDDRQCKAITKKGTRCKRKAQPGSDYCWQHAK